MFSTFKAQVAIAAGALIVILILLTGMAYAPAEDPKIAIAMVVENVGFGAANAAPIARRAFDYYLLGQYPSEEDIAKTQLGQTFAPIGTPRKAADVPLLPPAAPASAPASGASK